VHAETPGRAFEAEVEEIVLSLESGRHSPLLSGDLARDAAMICHEEAESLRGGRLAVFRP